VGKIPISHGLETADRYKAPNEFDDVHLRDASWALRLGELEAAVEGDPPLASDAWRTLSAQAYVELDNFKASHNVIEGDQGLSEKAHAQAAASHLKNIAFVTALAHEQTADTDNQHTLTEIIAEVAHSAFLAGQRRRAALGKTSFCKLPKHYPTFLRAIALGVYCVDP
jgi:hypothetical protein